MAPPLLTLQDVKLTFGGTPLLTSATLRIHERDRICLVGRNGSGKSTFMKIAAGIVEADDGEFMRRPDVTIKYLEQDPDLSSYKQIRDYIDEGLVETDDAYRVDMLLDALHLTGKEDPASMSGGETRRAALARVLAPEPDILMLDEPTNHLDLPVIEWLEDELRSTKSALVLISHDRRFLENMTDKTVWLDRGETKELDKGFKHFEEWRDTVMEQEELEQHKLDRKIVREEHWITYGVTARRKRNVRRLKELDGLRKQRKEAIKAPQKVNLVALDAGQSGKLVIEATDLSKSFDGRNLIDKFSIRINRGDRIGISGPNGTGKTTLLNMLMGKLEPDTGSVRIGTNLEVISLDQKRATLKPETRLIDAVTDGRGDSINVGGSMRHAMSYLKDFLFLPEQVRSPISALSGGEKGRLALAIALAQPSNLLILDEPTNDLDLETLDLLQEMISNYAGTVLLVSHDRDFLDRTVTSMLVPEGKGHWQEYPGGFSDMAAQRKLRNADALPDKQVSKEPAKQSTKAPTAPKTQSKKLSYKEQYALDNLPAEMEALEKEIAVLKEKIGDPDFFNKDPEGFNKTAAKLENLEKDLEEKEEYWLEIEMKRESLS